MQRNALNAALDMLLGRNTTEAMIREIRATIARTRSTEPHPRRTTIGRVELETLMRQLSRSPRRG